MVERAATAHYPRQVRPPQLAASFIIDPCRCPPLPLSLINPGFATRRFYLCTLLTSLSVLSRAALASNPDTRACFSLLTHRARRTIQVTRCRKNETVLPWPSRQVSLRSGAPTTPLPVPSGVRAMHCYVWLRRRLARPSYFAPQIHPM
jgi:hypothetical protein